MTPAPFRPWWRRILLCWWSGCGGHIDHDGRSVYWQCAHCSRLNR